MLCNCQGVIQDSMKKETDTIGDCALSEALLAIADHFEAIEHLMAEMRAYYGAQQAREAAQAFRRTKTLMESEQVAESYFSHEHRNIGVGNPAS